MASTSAVVVSMAIPRADASFKPLPALWPVARPAGKFQVKASLTEKAVATALTSSMVVPDVAEAASGASPSLNNFLLSVAAGGVVLTAIVGAVIGVSNFDPVKRA